MIASVATKDPDAGAPCWNELVVQSAALRETRPRARQFASLSTDAAAA